MIRLAFVGDFCPSIEQEKNILANNFNVDSALVKKIEGSDYVFLNLEGYLGLDEKKQRIFKGGEHLAINEAVLNKVMPYNNIVCCLANNHSFDYDIKGVQSTLTKLKNSGCKNIGIARMPDSHAPLILKAGSEKLAIFNVAEGEEGLANSLRQCGVESLFSASLELDIKEASDAGYLCILISHAGAEHLHSPPPHIVDRYKKLISRGIKLIVGHHPHVLQGYEDVNDYSIFYSLGNFIMHKKSWPEGASIGGLLTVDIQSNDIIDYELNTFEISNSGLRCLNLDTSEALLQDRNDSLKKFSELWDRFVLDNYSFERKFSVLDTLLSQNAKNYSRLNNTLYTITHQKAFTRVIEIKQKTLLSESSSRYFLYKNLFKRVYKRLLRMIRK
jgi:poly-gamma-glutamate capsule biosynthesis protein CapA/YwtB (metallophosphatase superfamily)